MRGTWLWVVALGAVACGSEPEAPPADVRPNNNNNNNSRRDAGVDAGGEDEVDPLAPKVEILAPLAATSPSTDEIVTAAMVTVRCKVTRSAERGSRDLDKGSVRITLLAREESMRDVMGVVTPSTVEHEYEATFSLAEWPNGPVSFTCAADDVGMPPRTTSQQVDTLLDLGPSVIIESPSADSRHALKDPVSIRFVVEAAPLGEDDPGAEVSSIELRILDEVFEFEEDPNIKGQFTQSIDFSDRTRFQMPPTRADVVVLATNSREPEPVQRRVSNDIVLDAAGPSITIESPKDEALVRGQVRLMVKISDPSGVQTDSVSGRINTAYPLDEWEIDGDVFVTRFDTRTAQFEGLPEISLDITASDNVGNTRTVDLTLRLDNVAPLVSLDPPVIREWMELPNGDIRCSAPFDPVGEDASNDLQTVLPAAMFRALVFDDTNWLPGVVATYHAGINEGSVRLFARADDGIPLLIDTDADGQCDDINSEALDEAERPAVTTLSPADVRGTAYYPANTDFTDPAHTPSFTCVAGSSTKPGDPWCSGTLLHRVIPGPQDYKPKAIFAITPRNGTGAACEGNSWSIGPIFDSGWVCVAAIAFDTIGNRGVSPPIRVCLDNGGATPCEGDPPSCVDDCRLPDDLPANYTQEQK